MYKLEEFKTWILEKGNAFKVKPEKVSLFLVDLEKKQQTNGDFFTNLVEKVAKKDITQIDKNHSDYLVLSWKQEIDKASIPPAPPSSDWFDKQIKIPSRNTNRHDEYTYKVPYNSPASSASEKSFVEELKQNQEEGNLKPSQIKKQSSNSSISSLETKDKPESTQVNYSKKKPNKLTLNQGLASEQENLSEYVKRLVNQELNEHSKLWGTLEEAIARRDRQLGIEELSNFNKRLEELPDKLQTTIGNIKDNLEEALENIWDNEEFQELAKDKLSLTDEWETRLRSQYQFLAEKVTKLEKVNNPSSSPFLTNHWKALLIVAGIALVAYYLMKNTN